jgi:hypothetical protein
MFPHIPHLGITPLLQIGFHILLLPFRGEYQRGVCRGGFPRKVKTIFGLSVGGTVDVFPEIFQTFYNKYSFGIKRKRRKDGGGGAPSSK